MLPKKTKNIYPKTKENLSALMLYYFAEFDLKQEGSIDYLKEKTSLSLNQIEFIARKLSESYNQIFKEYFKSETTVSNLMRYGINGLTKKEDDWNFGPHSEGRPKIKEFILFVQESEIISNTKND